MMKIKFTNDERFNGCGVDVVDGPIYTDSCEHGPECYVCSIREFRHPHNKETEAGKYTYYDLYLFPQKHYGMEVCIRYGNEGSEYISPGSLMEFLAHANTTYHFTARDVYYLAAQIIRNKGTCIWTPRE